MPDIVCRGNSFKLSTQHVMLNVGKFFFTQTITEGWNNLPENLVGPSSVSKNDCFLGTDQGLILSMHAFQFTDMESKPQPSRPRPRT